MLRRVAVHCCALCWCQGLPQRAGAHAVIEAAGKDGQAHFECGFLSRLTALPFLSPSPSPSSGSSDRCTVRCTAAKARRLARWAGAAAGVGTGSNPSSAVSSCSTCGTCPGRKLPAPSSFMLRVAVSHSHLPTLQLAKETYEANRSAYHPIAAKLVAADLKLAEAA